jgi:hypothetical protein
MTSDTTTSAHPKTSDLHIPGILVVGLSALMRAAGARGRLHYFGYWPYPPIERLQADWHIPGLPVVQRPSRYTCRHNPISRCSASPSSALKGPRMILPPRSAQIRGIKTNTKRAAASREIRQAPDVSSTRGTARKKPGCIVMRHFRDWLLCCYARGQVPLHLNLQGVSGMRISDGTTAR